MTDDPDTLIDQSSPPCFAGDPKTQLCDAMTHASAADNIARWRTNERARLIEMRLSVPAIKRKQAARRVALQLDSLVDQQRDKCVVSLYWPFRGELNLRSWMEQSHARGVSIALPEVVAKAQPLVFRLWTPEARMAPGVWNIPVPVDGAVVVPDVVIAPLVGYDPKGYRLGYGGGFFDRTLAAMANEQATPLVVGVGHSCAAIASIFPQSHDLPMSVILTEAGRIPLES